jgi:hypothetical protein
MPEKTWVDLIAVLAMLALCSAVAWGLYLEFARSWWGDSGHCENAWADFEEKPRTCANCGGKEFEPSPDSDLMVLHWAAAANSRPAGESSGSFPIIPLCCTGCGEPLA